MNLNELEELKETDYLLDDEVQDELNMILIEKYTALLVNAQEKERELLKIEKSLEPESQQKVWNERIEYSERIEYYHDLIEELMDDDDDMEF